MFKFTIGVILSLFVINCVWTVDGHGIVTYTLDHGLKKTTDRVWNGPTSAHVSAQHD